MFGANAGSGVPGGDDGGFVGHIGELIIYGNGSITPEERTKVDSYLAIKYGVTLDHISHYVTSQDQIIWDATANYMFHYNIAGIGHDITSDLHQKQSRSQHANTNDQVIISLQEIAPTNEENPHQLEDGQFLVWGDNGNKQPMTNAATTYSTFSFGDNTDNGKRMNRIWKVQNTNVAQEVLIRFPVTAVSNVGQPSFGANEGCAEYVIIFASDADFTTNVTIKTLSNNNGFYDITHTFPNDSSYFTYGKIIPSTHGKVYLPTESETTIDYTNPCDTGNWRYFRKSDDNALKLLGITGFTPNELDSLTVNIVTERTDFLNDQVTTKLMPRITTIAHTVTNTNSRALSSENRRVRVYFSTLEQEEILIEGAKTNNWFAYNGSANEVLADIYSDGSLERDKAAPIIPLQNGVEDGVHYVEFAHLPEGPTTSYIYLSSTSTTGLPVKLVHFTANAEQSTISLQWSTVEESNFAGFEVQYSNDLTKWETIAFVEAKGSDESTDLNTLHYTYQSTGTTSGVHYYRLKLLDLDNTYEYSKQVAVQVRSVASELLVIYPNPVTHQRVHIKVNESTIIEKIAIYNSAGVEFVVPSINTDSSISTEHLPSGSYIVKVTTKDKQVLSRLIVIP